jgi:putative transposase
MVAALTSRRLGRQVNRTRAQRVCASSGCCNATGRSDGAAVRASSGSSARISSGTWTSAWVAEHGWTSLNAIIDCCTSEIVGWSLELRCHVEEAIELADHALAARGIDSAVSTMVFSSVQKVMTTVVAMRRGQPKQPGEAGALPEPRK